MITLRIFSIIPLSLIDCRKGPCMLIFLSGCNMKCPYCQNYPAYLSGKTITLEELRKMVRENWAVDIVKFTGGEPTLHRNSLIEASQVIEEEGLGIAIDTNGTHPDIIEKLAKKGLSEAAVDLKATRVKYSQVTGTNAFDDVLETIKVLEDYSIDFEVRTTVALPLITYDDLTEMASTLSKLEVPLWVLQVYQPTKHTPKFLISPHLSSLKALAERLSEKYSLNIKIR